MDHSCGCCGSSGCCENNTAKKKLLIDFLYLDLGICTRCQGTEKNLDEAVFEVSAVLKAAGYDVIVNKVHITSKELANRYRFVSSPTIRINGIDIDLELKETNCEECGDLCGDTVDCRVWTYNGMEYTLPPKELIINAILKEVYSEKKAVKEDKNEYTLPNNLEVFFNQKGLNGGS
ncbi:MAG: DUF2703 domain-containing protein [Clostridiales bacterium]|nr:DUF2703 domain-containing protein [Clostridiales bacterium]